MATEVKLTVKLKKLDYNEEILADALNHLIVNLEAETVDEVYDEILDDIISIRSEEK